MTNPDVIKLREALESARIEIMTLEGSKCLLDDLEEILAATASVTEAVEPVAWRMSNGQFWAFQTDATHMRDRFRSNGWEPLYAAHPSPSHQGAMTEEPKQEPVPGAINIMLWLYHRLPRCYERPPFVEDVIRRMGKQAGIDVEEFLADRDTAPSQAAAMPPAVQSGKLLDTIMEQVQVFASAWAMVGGPFDAGNAMEDAENEKIKLRQWFADLLASSPSAAPAVKHFLTGDPTVSQSLTVHPPTSGSELPPLKEPPSMMVERLRAMRLGPCNDAADMIEVLAPPALCQPRA